MWKGRNLVLEVVWADLEQTKVPRPGQGAGAEEGRRDRRPGHDRRKGRRRAATSGIPIVARRRERLSRKRGWSRALPRPGRASLTGIIGEQSDAATKQTELMREILPNARRAAVIWQGARSPFLERQRKELEANPDQPVRADLAHGSRQERPAAGVRGAPDLPAGVSRRPDGPDRFRQSHGNSRLRNKNEDSRGVRLPRIRRSRRIGEHRRGNIQQSFRLAADYVDRILKGTKPATCRCRCPTKLEIA
jgi:putative ABC transport system substrate-binding protein